MNLLTGPDGNNLDFCDMGKRNLLFRSFKTAPVSSDEPSSIAMTCLGRMVCLPRVCKAVSRPLGLFSAGITTAISASSTMRRCSKRRRKRWLPVITNDRVSRGMSKTRTMMNASHGCVARSTLKRAESQIIWFSPSSKRGLFRSGEKSQSALWEPDWHRPSSNRMGIAAG